MSDSVIEGERSGIAEWETTWGYIIQYNRDMLEASGVDIDAFIESLKYLPIDDWDNAWQAFSGVFSA